MNPSRKEAVVTVARRFAWLAPAIYMAVSVGMWAAHLVAPQVVGPVTNQTIVVSLIAALLMGVLNAFASALKPARSQPSATG